MAACGGACVTAGDHGVGVAGPRARGLPCLHGLDLPPQHQVVEAVQVLGGDGASHLRQERKLGMGTNRALSRSSNSRGDPCPATPNDLRANLTAGLSLLNPLWLPTVLGEVQAPRPGSWAGLT